MRGGPARRGRAGRRPGPSAVQVVRRRRVPGRQPDPGGAARPVARRPRRPVRGRRPGADDLLLRRGQLLLPPRLPEAVTPAPPRSSWSATTAPPRRSSTPPTGCWPAPRAPGSSCAPSARAAPRSAFAEHADEVAEAEQVAADILAMTRAGTPAARDRGAVPDQRPVRGLRGGARGPRGALRRCAGRPASSSAPRSSRPSRCCAATPAAARAAATGWSPTCGAVLAGMGWTPKPPAGRGNVRDRWESLQAIVSPGRGAAPAPSPHAGLTDFVAELDRRAAEQHAPVAEGVTLATLHAAKGLEWDAVFVAGMHEGTMPIVYADDPGGRRGGAPAALRRDDPRPAAADGVLGAGAQPRRPLARASRRASSPRCGRRAPPTGPPSRGPRAASARA